MPPKRTINSDVAASQFLVGATVKNFISLAAKTHCSSVLKYCDPDRVRLLKLNMTGLENVASDENNDQTEVSILSLILVPQFQSSSPLHRMFDNMWSIENEGMENERPSLRELTERCIAVNRKKMTSWSCRC